MQMEGGGPWTGTVLGHLLETDEKKKINQLEKHRKILMNGYKSTFFLNMGGVTMALTCSSFLLDNVVPV